ncbi:ATP-dependent DNA ligase [Candidatus Babeliales bacterium]|nr:ATP-dependent DNA ligase [Candidatus Babeliales bacterium]
MKFSEVAQTFDELEQESSRLVMTHALADLLKKATPSDAATIAYLSLGSLRPPYLSTQFNFAQKSAIKVVAKLVGATEAEVKTQASSSGDVAVVIAHAHQGLLFKQDLTLHEIDKKLHQFLNITGTGSQDEKDKFLLELLRMIDPVSGKYVMRIILGKLRLGFSDMTLIDAFSWMEAGDKSLRHDLEDAYNVSADIGLIIKTLKEEGIEGVRKIGITPGIPIRPAAAERLATSKDIVKKLGPCIAQPKLDGFRLQVHVQKRGNGMQVHFFSRNLIDMSDMFPDLFDAVKHLDVTSFVGEGEAICYDEETESFLPFQETVRRKRKHGIEEAVQEFPLQLHMFDALFLNGESLLEKPHTERRKILEKVFGSKQVEKEGVIHLVAEHKVESAQDLEKYFKQTITVGLEGVVVKRPDAIYQPGKRNFNWIKLKREESGSLSDTLDCVILGYYAGHGKRSKFGIGAFLVGVYNKKNDCYETIAKIGTGLTDDEWRAHKKMCDDDAVVNKPKNVACAKELYPDVWVSPKMVCLVRADEITKSPLHQAGATQTELGYALRFPRIMGYREDKSAQDATTVKEVAELFNIQFEKKKKRA